MKRKAICVLLVLTVSGFALAGGGSEQVITTRAEAENDGVPVSIRIVPGDHFDHKMKIFPLIRITNNPQIALWAEDSHGEFFTTLFVTERIATENWRSAPGDDTPKDEIRRPGALPVWTHRHNPDQMIATPEPSESASVADAVTGATPNGSFVVDTRIPATEGEIFIYLEVNMSTDFNEAFPADAQPASANYSGGEWGSGQPALIYRGSLDTDTLRRSAGNPTALELIGRASPDGDDGQIYRDLSGITTAREILAEVWILPGSSE